MKVEMGKTPDERPIGPLQARRLAMLTGLPVGQIADRTIAQLGVELRWRIDPQLLFFRRICGRVVRTDPVTGVQYPVPNATVHVEDTDCSFLGYFPPGWPWTWIYPFFCRREEIATVVTDACGRFCVWVPRWEIDWILRWRRERFCLPIILVRPRIWDLLGGLREPIVPPRPGPGPDPPPPPLLSEGGMPLRRAEELVGRETAGMLAALEAEAGVGASRTRQLRILTMNGFQEALPPPLPTGLRGVAAPQLGDATMVARPIAEDKNLEAALATLSGQLKLDVKELGPFDFRRFIGPFFRCFDVIVPEWVPILDVPDITFRVTQDVDGDGDEEVIYSEGFFDIRWDAGAIPDVTLEASQIARVGVTCDPPDVVCGNVPAILFAGLMPLVNPAAPADPYHDALSGYARRPNRPHPSGLLLDPPPNPLAEAPYTQDLQLYGCVHVQGAAYYRLRYALGAGPTVPFTGLTWPLYRVVGGILQTLWPVPDANGWYPILPEADGWFPPHLLLNWPTGGFQNGLYTADVQVGNAAKAVLNTSAPVRFRVDNSNPLGQFTELRWRVAGGAWSPPVDLVCPVIPRPRIGGVPADLEFMVSYQASATHLRSLSLSGGGCGGGNPTLVSAPATAQHWHANPLDNAYGSTAIFALPGTQPQGAYGFNLFVAGRAFNPAGGDGGFAADWNYDPVYRYVWRTLPVAVVNV